MSAAEMPAHRQSSITQSVRLLRQRWWVLALCAVLGLLIALGIDSQRQKQYEATATLLFGSTSSNITGALNSNASNVSNDPQRDQGTTLSLVTSNEVARRVKSTLALPGSVSSLADAVTASAQPNANLIDVTALDSDPARAARLANAFAEQYKAFRQESDRAGLAQGIQNLEVQLRATAAADSAQRTSILDALSQLRVLQAGSTGGVQVVDRADAPSIAALPRIKRDVVLGTLLGIVLGAFVVFALDLFDRRIRTVAELEDAYGLPAMTVVPLRTRTPRKTRDRIAALEPFRILRSGLSLLDLEGSVRVVLVTSAVPAEGKSTTAAGLARAMAFSGASVALVEVDLRRPTFVEEFGLDPESPGLVHALMGRERADTLLQRVDPDLQRLEVLPSGGIPQRSAELLGSTEMTGVLNQLLDRVDFVVLDAPPLLPVADTRALLELGGIDACLLVGRLGATTREQARRTRAVLLRHRIGHLGLVVNGQRHSDASDDYTYYTTTPTISENETAEHVPEIAPRT